MFFFGCSKLNLNLLKTHVNCKCCYFPWCKASGKNNKMMSFLPPLCFELKRMIQSSDNCVDTIKIRWQEKTWWIVSFSGSVVINMSRTSVMKLIQAWAPCLFSRRNISETSWTTSAQTHAPLASLRQIPKLTN